MKHFYTLIRTSFVLLLLLTGMQKAFAQAPTITTPPASTAACSGSSTFFFVNATGTGTLTYQWQVDQGTGYANVSGAAYSGSTTSVLIINPVSTTMNGFVYRCVVTNSSGSTSSSGATLTVRTAPVVNTNPSNVTICSGNSTSFSITASGSGTLGYQWQVSTGGPFSNVPAAAPYSGATTNTLTINPVASTMNNYVYQCVVTATSGGCTPAATSNTAVLTVNSAASVTAGPSNATVCAGTGTSFSVTATGTSISYQWQLSTNGGATWSNVPASAPYSGTTTATLSLSTTAVTMDGYLYRCVVTSSVCSPAATSSNATLNVTALPAITGNPSNVTQCAGPGTSFSVTATGAGISYQWQLSTDGGATWNNLTSAGAYSGVNTATLTLSFTTAAMNGYRYRCVVSGTCLPNANSNAAILNISASPSITTHPSNTTVCPNSTATFTVSATGAGLTYQWQVSTGGPFSNVPASSPYSGTTTASLTINPASSTMAGYQYRVVITGSCTPPVTSNTATLSFYTNVSTTNPSSVTVCPGVATSFSVTASGAGPYGYQWQYSTNGGITWNTVPAAAPYSGTTTATLGISNPTNAMNGYLYRCIVSGLCSPSATSNAATLNVNTSPSVATQPRDTAGCPGTLVTYTVAGAGTGPLTYQWQVSTNGGVTWNNTPAASPYSGTTTATLSVSPITSTMNNYLYRCIISGLCSPSVTSGNARLTIYTAPVVTSSPLSNTVCAGSPDSFQVVATGTGLTYQWQLSTNGGITWNNVPAAAPYSGTTSVKLLISSVTAAMNGYRYRCIVSGTCTPAATSGTAILTVNTSPTITSSPSSVTVCPGNPTSFSVTATGTTLTYVWQYSTDGGTTWNNVPASAPYSGTITATLGISNPTSAMNGYKYRVVVSGACNPGVISASATLNVNAVPAVTTQPVNAELCAGGDTSFKITATGAGITYQWQVSSGGPFSNVPAGAPYSGTTTNTLLISGVTAAMNGYQYRCVVVGTCTPSAISNAATLTVNTAPNITTQPVSTTVCDNGTPTFTVGVTGAGLTYQWQEDKGFGWSNVPGTSPYIGGTTFSLSITGATLSMNGYKYRCIVMGKCSPIAISNIAILTVTTTTSWTGAISSAWSNPGNWSCNTLPSATTSVIIPAAVPNMPLVDIPTAICDSMSIAPGASVSFTGAFNILEIKGSVFNSGTFDASAGKVIFSGVGQQLVPSSTYFDLELANRGDKVLSDGTVSVFDSLIFTNGYLALGNYDVFAGPLCGIYGGNSTSYILTNGLGKALIANIGAGPKAGDNLIPIGALRNSYTPVTLNNSGTPDTFRVWVYSAVYKFYYNDIPTTVTLNENAVGRSWIIEEYNKGGSNMNITLQWNAADELPGFDRNACYTSHYGFGTWKQVGNMMPAAGTGPYSMTLSNISVFSPFGVGSAGSPLPVNKTPKVTDAINVYPNPVTGPLLYVKFSNPPANFNVRITDVIGKTWTDHVDVSAISAGVLPVNVSTLPQGVYMLQVIDQSGTPLRTIRFVKQ